MKRANSSWARGAAVKLIKAYRARIAPVPVERIIKAEGIVLQFVPMGEDLSGLAFVKDDVKIIAVNSLHHTNRQRFSAAHELAHHVLHAQELQKEVHIDRSFQVLRRDSLASQGVDALEIEANAFASELLMPFDLLSSHINLHDLDLDEDDKVEALARKFRVSSSALRYRLARLDVT